LNKDKIILKNYPININQILTIVSAAYRRTVETSSPFEVETKGHRSHTRYYIDWNIRTLSELIGLEFEELQ